MQKISIFAAETAANYERFDSRESFVEPDSSAKIFLNRRIQ